MEHVLDNPAWNALISGNQYFANGNNQVKFFDKEVSPFVAFKNDSADNFQVLHDLIEHQSPVLLISTVEIEIPAMWKLLRIMKGFQMVFDGDIPLTGKHIQLIPLTVEHVPQMLALTKLTNPGPFAERTIEFGHYQGIFDGDKLAAMAGQRLHAFNYAEISAVCTHPDYVGRGYARELLIHQIQRIKVASEVPFLHVRYDNDRAIKVYADLGFKTRTEVYFYVLVKNI